MAKTEQQPKIFPFNTIHKAAKIGSLVMGAVLTTLEIVKVIKDEDEPESVL